MKTFNVYEAKTNFSKLLALVEQGEEVIIAKNGKPLAEIKKHTSQQSKVKAAFGSMTGQISYKDEDLTGTDPDIQEMFYGKDWDKE